MKGDKRPGQETQRVNRSRRKLLSAAGSGLAGLTFSAAIAALVAGCDGGTAEVLEPVEKDYGAWPELQAPISRDPGHRSPGEINSEMPRYVVHKVSEALNDFSKPLRGSKVAMLGVAYKKDVDDPRESPSFRLMELLAEGGAVLSYSDPHIPRLPSMRSFDVPALEHEELTAEYLQGQDCVLIATDHSAYDYEFIARHAPLIVDTRNAMANVSINRDRIRKA